MMKCYSYSDIGVDTSESILYIVGILEKGEYTNDK